MKPETHVITSQYGFAVTRKFETVRSITIATAVRRTDEPFPPNEARQFTLLVTELVMNYARQYKDDRRPVYWIDPTGSTFVVKQKT